MCAFKLSGLYDCGDESDPSCQEDAFILTAPLYGVLDATSGLYHPQDGPRLFDDGVSGGRMISRIVQMEAAKYVPLFSLLRRLSHRRCLSSFLCYVNKIIRDQYRNCSLPLSNPSQLPGASFLFVMMGDHSIHFVQGSDCFAVWEFVDGRRGATSNPVFGYTKLIQHAVRRLMEKHRGDRFAMWKDLLSIERTMRNTYINRPGGILHLNGDPAMMRGVRFFRIDSRTLARLLIFTDGFVPFEVTETPEGIAGYVMDYYHRGNRGEYGLRTVLSETRQVQEAGRQRTHVTFPEATAIAFEF